MAKKSLITSIALVVAVLMLFTACQSAFSSKTDEGTGNLNSKGVATTIGNEIYYKHPFNYQLYKSDLKTDESVTIGENSFCAVNVDGSVFYLSFYYDEETQESGFKMHKITENGDVLIFSDSEITYPQIAGNYIYYLKSVPEFHSGYSSRVYRAELSEGSTPELVCDVLCNTFYVDGDTIYYGDVNATALMSASLENAINVAKTAPLEATMQRSSSELGASVIIADMVLGNITAKGNSLYFIDYSNNQGEFLSYDLNSKTIRGFNNGITANNYNISGNYIYYHNASDYCIYRMKLDGSDIEKVSSICDGQIILSGGKLIYVGISTNEETYGDRYIAVCEADGTVIRDITFTEDYDPYRNMDDSEGYYDDYAYAEEASEESAE